MITRMHCLMLPLLITAVTRSASAQGPVTAAVDVTAQIISPITIASTHALDFGRVFNASTKTVAPNVAASGHVEVSGTSGSAVNLSVTMPTVLKAASSDQIAVVNWNYMLSSNATLVGATPVGFNAGVAQPIAAVLGGTGGVTKLYLGLGATLQASASAPMGSYTGTGQVTAAYADL